MKSFVLLPHITEKSLTLVNQGQYQFTTPVWATKKQIADQIAKHFSVTVVAVQTARMPSVAVTFRRQKGRQSAWKKVTAQLKSGDTIAEFSLPPEATPALEKDTSSPALAPKAESQITVRSKSKKQDTK
jgi:ribosomal protein L23